MAKSTANTEDKLEQQDFDLFKAIEAVDNKQYDYFQKLTDEQQRKFVPYMMLHWISTVKASREISNYYLMATDIVANKHMFNESIQNHPELQWMMLCSASPGVGKQFHQWLPHLNSKFELLREQSKTKDYVEYLSKIYKNSSASDIKELAEYMTANQQHRHKLAQMYPELKVDDINTLAQMISEDDIKNYETEAGIN